MLWYLPLHELNPQTILKTIFASAQLTKVLEELRLQLIILDLEIKNNQRAFTRGLSTFPALVPTTQKWFNITHITPSGRKIIHAVFLV